MNGNNNEIKRLNYWHGQFLQQEDFIDEQSYHIRMRAEHHKGLHIPGVIEGLTVSQVNDKTVKVEAGSALDETGKLVVLFTATEKTIPDDAQSDRYVILLFDKEGTDSANYGDKLNTRWKESSRVRIVVDPTKDPDKGKQEKPVVLARLQISDKAITGIDGTVCHYSGARGEGHFSTVGIGTTNPGTKLEIEGLANETDEPQLRIENPENAKGKFAGIRMRTAAGWDVRLGTVQDKHWLVLTDGGGVVKHSWKNMNYHPGDASAYITGSGFDISIMDGNVGIGTTDPAARLSFGLASGQVLLVHQNDQANVRSGLGIDMTGEGKELNVFFPGGKDGHLSIGTVSENDLTTYAEKVRVTENGNVGIGTSGSDEKLRVAGNLRLNDNRAEIYTHDRNHMIVLRGLQDGKVQDSTSYYQYGGTLKQELGHRFFTGGSVSSQKERMRISDDGIYMAGNVGIGTPDPQIHLAIGDSDTGLKQQGDGKLAIYTNNQERVRIDDNGYVGIGTDAPLRQKLTVKGNIKLGNRIYGTDIGSKDALWFMVNNEKEGSAGHVMALYSDGSDINNNLVTIQGALKVNGTTKSSSSETGVLGESYGGRGVSGYSFNGWGVHGESINSYAGYFDGKVSIGTAGTDKGAKLQVFGDIWARDGIDHAMKYATDLQNNTTLKSGIYNNHYDGLLKKNGTENFVNGWWHVINMHGLGNDGYNSQIAVPFGTASPKEIYFRTSAAKSWSEWRKVLSENSAGNVAIGTTDPGNDKLDVRGSCYSSGGWKLSNADYAEYFESSDGSAIPVGTSVALTKDGKIKPANKKETPIGIVTANSAIVGNCYKEWPQKYVRDDFGNLDMEKYKEEIMIPKKKKVTKERQKVEKKVITEETTHTEIVLEKGKYIQKEIAKTVTREIEEPLYEEFDLYDTSGKKVVGKHRVPIVETYVEEIEAFDKNGQPILVRSGKAVTKKRLKLNPEYDESKKYVPREDRPEWNCVGLLGQLPLYKGQPVAESWIKIKEISDKVELWLVR